MADLDQMIVFARVVREGSFSAAARELGVPPSTVSRRISALEARLGLSLLKRSTRRLTLTEAGAVYAERCQRIAEQVQSADDAVQALAQRPRGDLLIAAPPTLGIALLAKPVARMRALHPQVRVGISLSDSMVDLLASPFDLAIRAARSLSDSSLRVRRISQLERLWCASPAYLQVEGAPQSERELAERAQIGVGPWRPSALGSTGEERARATPSLQVNSALLAAQLCCEGAGIARLPDFVAHPLIEAGRLLAIPTPQRPDPLPIWVVLPPGRARTAKVQVFLELLEAHLQRSTEPATPTTQRTR